MGEPLFVFILHTIMIKIRVFEIFTLKIFHSQLSRKRFSLVGTIFFYILMQFLLFKVKKNLFHDSININQNILVPVPHLTTEVFLKHYVISSLGSILN